MITHEYIAPPPPHLKIHGAPPPLPEFKIPFPLHKLIIQ